jgi:hypothetical protein
MTIRCINTGIYKRIRTLGVSLIVLAKYWCLIKGDDYQVSLHISLPSDMINLDNYILNQ